MIDLRDARISDGVPDIVAAQPWVRAMSLAFGVVMRKILDDADASQIFTGVDTAPEELLDILAVNFKVDWYDTAAPLETKRQQIKQALQVRRTIGTASALKKTVQTVLPNTRVEEWFECGGPPGTFDLHTTDSITPEIYEKLPYMIDYTKNVRSHMRKLVVERETVGKAYLAAAMQWRGTLILHNTLSGEMQEKAALYSVTAMTNHPRKMLIHNTVREKMQESAAAYSAVATASRKRLIIRGK